MTEAYWNAFFQLHRDLPREGPGEPADVFWAAEVAGLRPDARICDAACGPGADIAALRAVAPNGHVTALDKTEAFVEQAKRLHGQDPQISVSVGDMAEIHGSYDLIWCAGAVYFLGVTKALQVWRDAVAPGGSVAFSQICWFDPNPSDAARAGWSDYADMTDEAGVEAAIAAAGYECLATRRLSNAAWEAYFTPLDARIAALRPMADAALTQVLDEASAEADLWRAESETFGYQLCVVRPL